MTMTGSLTMTSSSSMTGMSRQWSTPEAVTKPPSKRIASAISGKRYRKRDLVSLDALRPALADFIPSDFPALRANTMISLRELARYQLRLTAQLL